MIKKRFTAIIERDDDWYVSHGPELDIVSQGRTIDLLARHGFDRVRQRGSHIVKQTVADGTTFTSPAPDHP